MRLRSPRIGFFLSVGLLASPLTAALGACGFDKLATKEAEPFDAATDVVLTDGASPDGARVSDAGLDGNDEASIGCRTGRSGPPLIRVPDSGYCIDATEVTNSEYDAFLAALDAGTPPPVLPKRCDNWLDFRRKPTGQPESGPPDAPVARVGWCDAYAYCRWSGKRLCGSVNQVKGPTAVSEWFAACSNHGTRDYPYPGRDPDGSVGAYVPEACNTNHPLGSTVAVASMVGCEGGVPGVFDMSGNVEEFVDGCKGAQCPVMGGSFVSADRDVKCESVRLVAVGVTSETAGFRCCADP